MNEVEKLYSLANIKPLGNADLREMKILVDGKVFVEGKYLPNNYYNIYPPFTAKKQLNIIKWLLKSYDIGFSQLGERIDTSLDGVNCISGLGSGNTFEESLAQAINDLWQDLTEEDKAQIKEILE